MVVSIDAQTLPWGVNSIDGDLSSTVSGDGTGSVTNVRVYVIDTGIQRNHPDLNVVGGVDFTTTKGGNGDDKNGHGTHVAGTIAARDNDSYVVGIVPGAPLYAVRVLGANGTGSTSGIVKGIDYVTAQKQANPNIPMVANMSLGAYVGTTAYSSMDNAVARSISYGVFYSLAAGNSSADARLYSPAHTVEAVTVGAYASNNVFASYSNFGSIVDINAPGSNVLSTYKGSTTATLSGTSMASPHVCGTAALYLSTNTTASPATVRNALVASATSTVASAPAGTTNLAVYAGGY
jgi:subtilisin family serine protease